MKTPWIQVSESTDQGDFPPPGSSNFHWQAQFASQIEVLDHQNWTNLKWGFNAEALFAEAMERQKLFLESQHATKEEFFFENPHTRTMALRYISVPNEGLRLTLIGKLRGPTKNEVEKSAHEYYRELTAIFPYDYTLVPGTNSEEFHWITGGEILSEDHRQLSIVQIKRNEIPSRDKTLCLQGAWHSKGRAHEQIWRSLAASEYPVLINTTIRPTVIYKRDLEYLLKYDSYLNEEDSDNNRSSEAHKQWYENLVKRRIHPWTKYFYVQVHIASTQKIDENLARSVGTSLTLSSDGKSSLGFQIVFPPAEKTAEWSKKIQNLDLSFSGSQLPTPRLSEVADLEELFSAVRIPYSPPDLGRPIVKYIKGILE